ncbi:MAG TPA: tautomerase family protein [Treponemataceae bacterium]|nr:tautomerase family protein [Treponemataceae bacterium]
MPLVKINCLKIWDSNEKKIIHEAVHKALFDAFHIESWDFFHRFQEFEKEDFLYPSFKTDNFMIIEIAVFPGRTEEMKADLYKNICTNLSPLGLSPDDIFIQLTEQPLCNWGIGGKIKTMK